MKAYAICDGVRIMERSGTGQLTIFYALEDAVSAFPEIKKSSPEAAKKGLRICSVIIATPKQLPPRKPHPNSPAQRIKDFDQGIW